MTEALTDTHDGVDDDRLTRFAIVWLIICGLLCAMITAYAVQAGLRNGPAAQAQPMAVASTDPAAQAAWFRKMFERISQTDDEIGRLDTLLYENPDTEDGESRLLQLQEACSTDVEQYNAASESPLSGPLRPADLPATVGQEPMVNCAPDIFPFGPND